MCKRFLTPAIMLLFAFQTFAFQTGEERLVPDDKSFSVVMPSHPEKQDQRKDTEVGPILTQIWLSKVPNGIYLVGITDYPIDVDPKTELDLDQENFLKAVKGTLVSSTNITLGTIPGKEFVGTSATHTFKSVVFLKGRRVFQAVAGEPTSSINEERAEKFLRSFELGKDPQTKNTDPVIAPIIPRKSNPN
jgi:hypothetical protein